MAFEFYAGNPHLVEAFKKLVKKINNPGRMAVTLAPPSARILLEGPPGTGKTLFADECWEHLNHETILKWKRFDLSLNNVNSEYVGQKESKIIKVFAEIHRWLLADELNRAFIFMDEVESLVPLVGSNTNGSDSDVKVRAVVLQGIESHLDPNFGANVDKDKNVDIGVEGKGKSQTKTPKMKDRSLIIAASNMKSKIDPALIRPGRIDQHWFIDYLKTPDEIKMVFDVFVRKYKLGSELTEGFLTNIANVLAKTEVTTASRISTLFQYAFEAAEEEAVLKGKSELWDQIGRNPTEENIEMMRAFVRIVFDEHHLLEEVKKQLEVLLRDLDLPETTKGHIQEGLNVIKPQHDTRKEKILESFTQ
ncbi:MAG: AAA family ATPase [Patescibacteria group bacterium]